MDDLRNERQPLNEGGACLGRRFGFEARIEDVFVDRDLQLFHASSPPCLFR
jgi:hypothetical protein